MIDVLGEGIMTAPIFGQPLPVRHNGQKNCLQPHPPDRTRDTHAQAEGRDFLKLITEVDPGEIDAYQGHAIEAWLTEMCYDWNGQSWVMEAADD